MSKPKSLGIPKAYWEIEIRDKNGKLLERKRFKSHSWLRQFIDWLRMCALQIPASTSVSQMTINDVTNTSRTVPNASSDYAPAFVVAYCAGANVDGYGLVVGSGDAPNSISTYALASKIAHGSGSGQLIHNATTVEAVTNPSGGDLQFRVIRTFTNNSGTSVVVKEIGIYGSLRDSGINWRSFCIARDVLPSPSSIPDGATMTLRYITKITVS
jgi:hypothetical protein